MARIRSTHPGQWSDEDFVALSFPARILTLALRNVADDRGIFEWKPLTIKMQLLPADNIDVDDLLSELVGNNIVIAFEAEGKRYGAIRNFMRWQRPKKPSYQHPCPEPVLEYVASNEDVSATEHSSQDVSSVPLPHQSDTGSEIPPQRKEEGGRRKDVGGKRKNDEDAAGAAPPSSSRYAFEAKTIKLNTEDLEQWRRNCPSIRLEAELMALDDWAGSKGKNWFSAVSGALAKKEREAFERVQMRKLEIATPKPPTRQHIDGRI